MNEENTDAVVTSTDEEATIEPVADNTEEVEALKVKLAEAEEAKRQITARAHKAEEALKTAKTATQENKPENPFTRQQAEELLLQTQGVDEKRLESLRLISKAKNITMIEAQKDELYTSLDETLKTKERAEKAALGASRGSGRQEKPKEGPLTREEHLEKWKKTQGIE